jgi:2-amino-4-hydroxy-6-hydroxymethyldihydropteridine diphosphokinase
MTMSKRPVFIMLGSNVDAEYHLRQAVGLLNDQVGVVRTSGVYRTEAVGPDGEALDAPPYLNAAVLVMLDESVAPDEFKYRVLRPIEASLGRVRSADKSTPVTIDLDIAIFGDIVQDDPFPIPDPDSLTRAHVALPLADLDPDFFHPVTWEPLGMIAIEFARAKGIEAAGISIDLD